MVRMLVLLIVLALAAGARAEVVYLPTQHGAERFQRAASEPEALALFAYVEAEERQTFCGPASLAAALNSLAINDPTPAPMFPYHLLTQDSVFTAQNQAVKPYPKVESSGLTLNQLAQFAANLGASTEVIHALDLSADEMRTRLRAALGSHSTRVIVNYSRTPLGQEGDGHISPLAAYDAETDSFLILDVARYKYPPSWVSFDQLFAAMQRIDTDSGLSRGALILSNPARAARP
jgi:hypothetical protein